MAKPQPPKRTGKITLKVSSTVRAQKGKPMVKTGSTDKRRKCK